MNRIGLAIVFCAMGAASLSAQTKTITDKACHVSVPSDWKPLGPRSASAPGPKTFSAVVKSITPDDVKATVSMIRQGQLANYKAKILEENAKHVLIMSEARSPKGTTITHYQMMTKADPGCQGSVDFEDLADAPAARVIINSTTGAQ